MIDSPTKIALFFIALWLAFFIGYVMRQHSLKKHAIWTLVNGVDDRYKRATLLGDLLGKPWDWCINENRFRRAYELKIEAQDAFSDYHGSNGSYRRMRDEVSNLNADDTVSLCRALLKHLPGAKHKKKLEMIQRIEDELDANDSNITVAQSIQDSDGPFPCCECGECRTRSDHVEFLNVHGE